MNAALLLLTLVFFGGTSARAQSVCPESNDLEMYVDANLFSATQQNAKSEISGTLRMYTRLLTPFDAAKPTILIINGGPGGDHSIVTEFSTLSSDMNVISFDHRGLGCTKITSRFDSGFYRGLYSMERAADDLEALRRRLLGDDGKWWVYGVSYGGMLGQKYLIKYPTHVHGAILDSTFHKSTAIDVGRRQYKRLFIEHDPEVKGLYEAVVAKYPEARESVLWAMWGYTYSYSGRLTGLKDFFNSILAAQTDAEARAIYTGYEEVGPVSGMMYDILCSEIWDYPVGSDHSYYFAEFINSCQRYKDIRNPMDWAEDLRKLPMRTFIWAGAFDPVTPSSVMHEMHALIPNSLLYENQYAGHGLWWEKPECAHGLLRQFIAGASDKMLYASIASESCQAVPDAEKESLNRWERITGQKVPSF
jgi:pimeloyl-ACP methyl ester carboxylesterase